MPFVLVDRMNKTSLQFRPAEMSDFEACLAIDHHSQTSRLWQMEFTQQEGFKTARFQVVRLPRPQEINYPFSSEEQVKRWYVADYFGVAESEEEVCGYVTVTLDKLETVGWLSDVVVAPSWRRKGYGSYLVAMANQWAGQQGVQRLLTAVSTKNYPAIEFFQKNGFVFCGYNERLHPGDIMVFLGVNL